MAALRLAFLLLSSGCLATACQRSTTPGPLELTLSARVKPRPEWVALDTTGRRLEVARPGVGWRVALELGSPVAHVRSAPGAPGVHISYRGGPFEFSAGVRREGALIYSAGATSLVLTPGELGVKEDLWLTKNVGDALVLEWALTLDPGLEARAESDGSIGVYAAVAGGPRRYELAAPVLREANGNETHDGLRYELSGETVRLYATGLSERAYPVDLDPTIIISTTPELAAGGNLESDVSVLNDELTRLRPTSGFGAWSATTAFGVPRSGHSSAISNGCLYVLGGADAITTLNDVTFAPVTAPGTLGQWAAATSLPSPRARHSSVAYNGFIYVVGGQTGGLGLLLDETLVAKINSNGTLGPWVATTRLPSARAGFGLVASNGFLYALGGTIVGAPPMTNEVLVAAINADGSLGAWSLSPNLFTGVREDLGAAALNGFVYVAGGVGASMSELNDVQFARLLPDGSVGPWRATAGGTSLSRHSLVAAGASLFEIAGSFMGAPRSLALIAGANADGTLRPWIASPFVLPSARLGQGAAAANGAIYLTGGTGSGGPLNEVQATQIDSLGTLGGSIGVWQAGTALPFGQSGHATVTAKGFVYLISGADAFSSLTFEVQAAKLNFDGTLGPWGATTAVPSPGRLQSAAAVSGDFIYVSGGSTGPQADVIAARIYADGGLGPWAGVGSFSVGRYGHGSAAYNGRLYIFGGAIHSSGALNDVQFAPINPDGGLGPFTATTPFPTPRSGFGGLVHNGHLYVVGGEQVMAGPYLNDVQYASINADGTIGTWSATSALITPRSTHATIAYNGSIYVMAGKNPGLLSQTEVAAINPSGTLGAWASLPNLVTGRNFVGAAAADGVVTLFGGRTTAAIDEVWSAPILGPLAIGTYSRLVDFGSPAWVGSVVVNGSSNRLGVVKLAYRLAPSGGVLGPPVDHDVVALGQPTAIDATARSLWVRLTLDDTANTSAASSPPMRDVSDLTFSFLAADGAGCAFNTECLNGQCVDGVCCNSVCIGACDACDVLGSIGVCTNQPLGATGSPSCAPFVCSGGRACPGSCSTDAQCMAGTFCEGGACVSKKGAGAVCLGANQCASNFCVDGVCCNSSCGATCEACDVAGAIGACTAITTDPGCGATCTADGGSCEPPDAGLPDAGLLDSGLPDAGLPDAGLPDAGLPDAGLPDAGLPDAGLQAGRRYEVGCGCDAAGGGASALLMLLALTRARRWKVTRCSSRQLKARLR